MSRTGSEGVVVTETRLGRVLGDEGRLMYAGYEIEDLAANASFEEVCHLLWHGRLPSPPELAQLRARFADAMPLTEGMLDVVRLGAVRTHPASTLLAAIATAAFFDPDRDDSSPDAELRKAIRLTAGAVTVTAAAARLRAGREPIEPRPDLGLAANLLCMLHGRPASEAHAAELDTVLTLHAEHGMNASTFAARVAASTRTDLHAAVAAAMGTLKGPLHGGASEGVMRMLREIGSPGRARAWVESALERGERVMGFGHHHYRTVDPRVRILEAMAGRLLDGESDGRWLEISREIRSAMSAEMLRRGKAVYPNVDFFTASVYFALGIPPELSACVFACARMPGWTAHIMEQRTGRLIRPDAVYVGPEPRSTGRQGARP